MKKVLLIGKTGQLGSAIINDAPASGFEVVSFDRNGLDITNEFRLKEKLEAVRPDTLINTAAYHVVSQCEKNPMKAMETNFAAVFQMAKLCKAYGIEFATYSTDYVFDGEASSPRKEDDKPNPLQIYGISKLAGEYAALNLYSEGTFVIRTCGVYGGQEGSRQKGGNFVLGILQEAREKDSIEVSVEQFASPTYARHLSRATLELLNSSAQPGLYHLMNEGYCSWYEFSREIFKLAQIKKELKPVDRGGRSGDIKRPKFSVLGNFKAKALGIKLPSWREGVKEYLEKELNLIKA